MTKFVFKIIIFWLYFSIIGSQELDSDKISEDIEYTDEEGEYFCNINSDGIDCTNINKTDFDIKSEFRRLSNNLTEKHLKKFSLYFISNEEIPENAFYDISFDQILIYQTQNLTAIHSNAFNSSKTTTKRLTLLGTNHLSNGPEVNQDLYEAISSLVNLEYVSIELKEDSEHEIPENAFHAIDSNQNNLRSISYSGQYNISQIGNYAFADSPKLHQLIITEIPIKLISAHAFDSRHPTEQPLSVTLSDCSLSEENFETGIFMDLKRPLYLYLGDNQIRSIDEEIFGDLFSNENNTLDLMGNALHCDQIESFKWLLKKRDQLKDRITSAYCENGTQLWDLYIESNDDNNDSSTAQTTTQSATQPTTQSTPQTTDSSSSFDLRLIDILICIGLLIGYIQ